MNDSPKSVYIFTTNRCNLDCKYCYEKNRVGDMTPETMKATIDFLISHFNKENQVRPFENLSFTFFGGEPLLNFEVVKYGLEYIREKADEMDFKAGTHILTNGTILTDEMIKFFKSIRPYNNFNWHIQVSLDGCEETHNANRIFHNGEGSYNKILKNIKIYQEIFPSVGVRQTITPDNVKSLYKDFVAMIELGVKYTNFTPIVEGDWNDEAINIFVSELKKCIDYYYNNDKKQYFNLIHQSVERLINPGFNRERGCRAGLDFIGVSFDGKIYPCHRFVAYSNIKDYCIGDVFSGLNVEGDRFKEIECMRKFKVECNDCKVFSCNRCFATNMMLMKDPKELPTNGYCKMNQTISKALMPIIGRLIVAEKVTLKPGDMVDLKDQGVAFKVGDHVEVAVDKIDVMARCLLMLTKEIIEIKKVLYKKSE